MYGRKELALTTLGSRTQMVGLQIVHQGLRATVGFVPARGKGLGTIPELLLLTTVVRPKKHIPFVALLSG